jgi:hypothetical protein
VGNKVDKAEIKRKDISKLVGGYQYYEINAKEDDQHFMLTMILESGFKNITRTKL